MSLSPSHLWPDLGVLQEGRFLKRATLLYLALPWFIFLWGWLILPYALAGGALLLLGVVSFWNSSIPSNRNSDGNKSAWLSIQIIAVAFIWCLLAGAGGAGYQNPDWVKHNAILKDLIINPWPVLFMAPSANGSQAVPLVYYVAYYLPAAFVGKYMGWAAANAVLFLTTFVGAGLSLFWFLRLVGKNHVLVVIAFILFSGWDYVGSLFTQREMCWNWTSHLEWWAQHYSYQSNTTLLFWVPQHALAGWLVTYSMLDDIIHTEAAHHIFFLWALSLLWSPFVALGLLPIVAAVFLERKAVRFGSVANVVVAPALTAVGLLYFTAHVADGIPRDFLFSKFSFWSEAPRLLFFYLFEGGIYFFLLREPRLKLRELKQLRWCIISALILIPLVVLGVWNDFAMRVSIPSLAVFWFMIGRDVFDQEVCWRKKLLIVALVVGSLGPITEMARSLSFYSLAIPREEKVESVIHLNSPYTRQYIGKADSIFFKTMSTKSKGPIRIDGRW